MSIRVNLPDRWSDCPRKGNLINDLFLPFKTPLDEKYDDYLIFAKRFYPKFLIDSSNKTRLKLIIDLTKSDRFYDAQFFENLNIKHKKIKCEGHDGPPTPEQVLAFKTVVKVFLRAESLAGTAEDNPPSTPIIGVHCTHGFNRTGFVIISYLVEELEFDLEDAVRMFCEARPPGIYKQDYLDELTRRYPNFCASGSASGLEAPPRPDWCFAENPQKVLKRVRRAEEDNSVVLYDEEDVNDEQDEAEQDEPENDDDNEADEQDDGGVDLDAISTAKSSKKKKQVGGKQGGERAARAAGESNKRREFGRVKLSVAQYEQIVSRVRILYEQKLAQNYLEHVTPGVAPLSDPEEIVQVLARVANLVEMDQIRFPGSQPVSMTHERLERLDPRYYKVSWKADGTRFLLAILGHRRVYLIDRDNCPFAVRNLTFPRSAAPDEHQQFTLLDGELVIDRVPVGLMPPPPPHHTQPHTQQQQEFQMRPRYLVYDILHLSNQQSANVPPPQPPAPPAHETAGDDATRELSAAESELQEEYQRALQDYEEKLAQHQQSRNVMNCVFVDRMNLARECVVRPRDDAIQAGRIDRSAEAFSVRLKDFWDISCVCRVWEGKLRRQLAHKMDGIIFQPDGPNDFYVPGTCETTLKWKSSEENTIDFRLEIVQHRTESQSGQLPSREGRLYVTGSALEFGRIPNMSAKEANKYAPGAIVECRYLPATASWQILRVRTDKSAPNHYSTAQSVKHSIMNPVLIQHVYDAIRKHVALRPPDSASSSSAAKRPPPLQQQQSSSSSVGGDGGEFPPQKTARLEQQSQQHHHVFKQPFLPASAASSSFSSNSTSFSNSNGNPGAN